MVEPHSSNFRVITTNVLGVRIFGKFTVITVMILCFQQDRSGQTVQTQIRLLLQEQEQSDQGLHCLLHVFCLHLLDTLFYGGHIILW